jgi:hypothetical protein
MMVRRAWDHPSDRNPKNLPKTPNDKPEPPYRWVRYLSMNVTIVRFDTRSAMRSASQFVRRTQPCDSALEIPPGNGAPWIP